MHKAIYELAEKSESNQITVITNHLKIDGFIHQCDGRCKNLAEHVLTLTDAVVCNLDEYCTCDDEECNCNDFICFKYEWLNISLHKIVAFSIIK